MLCKSVYSGYIQVDILYWYVTLKSKINNICYMPGYIPGNGLQYGMQFVVSSQLVRITEFYLFIFTSVNDLFLHVGQNIQYFEIPLSIRIALRQLICKLPENIRSK